MTTTESTDGLAPPRSYTQPAPAGTPEPQVDQKVGLGKTVSMDLYEATRAMVRELGRLNGQKYADVVHAAVLGFYNATRDDRRVTGQAWAEAQAAQITRAVGGRR